MAKKKNKFIFIKRTSLTVFLILFIFFFLGDNIINLLGFERVNYIKEQKKIILIHTDVINELNYKYKNTEIERGFCLMGVNKEDRIIINSISEFRNIKADESSIQLHDNSKCDVRDEDMLGMLHFHLRSVQISNYGIPICRPSPNDLFNFGVWSEHFKPTFKLSIIMCGKSKLVINDFQESVYKPLRWEEFEK